jgi:hypothetical protein
MNQAIGDKAARKFAVGFYDALGAGRSIEDAYEFGCSAIYLEGIPEHLTPVLKKRTGFVPLPSDTKTIPLPSDTREIPLPEQEEEKTVDTVPIKLITLEEPEGQVPLESAFYVERPPIESDCYETIIRPGALIRVKAPRQMGKSSLTETRKSPASIETIFAAKGKNESH